MESLEVHGGDDGGNGGDAHVVGETSGVAEEEEERGAELSAAIMAEGAGMKHAYDAEEEDDEGEDRDLKRLRADSEDLGDEEDDE